MNKAALLTTGRKLNGSLHLISVFDLEPSGIIVHAYNQINSKEYLLPVTEIELAKAGFTRKTDSLTTLLESVQLVPQGDGYVLQSSIDAISNIKKRPTGDELEQLIKTPAFEGGDSIHDLLVTGLMELCKAKPVGLDAVKWLGEWLIENNPNNPKIAEDEE